MILKRSPKSSVGSTNIIAPRDGNAFIFKPHFVKLLLFFLVSVFGIALFTRFIFLYNDATNKTDLVVKQKYEMIWSVGNIKSSLAEADATLKDFNIAPGNETLQRLHKAQGSAKLFVKETIAIVHDSLQRKRLIALQDMIANQIFLQGGIINDPAKAVFAINNWANKTGAAIISQNARSLIDTFVKRQNILFKESQFRNKTARNHALITAIIGMIFFFLLVAIVLSKLGRYMTRSKKTGLQLSHAEDLTRTLLNNTNEGILIIDREYKILSINRQSVRDLQALSGKAPEPCMDFLEFILPSEKSKAIENFDRVFTGEKVTFESEYEKSSGRKWTLISHSPVQDGDGNITAALIITHDITERRNSELKIEESERRFRLTLEKLGDNFWAHDFSTKITDFSKNGYEFLGYKEEDFDNNINLWWKSIHIDDLAMLEENERRYNNGEIDFHSLEYRMI